MIRLNTVLLTAIAIVVASWLGFVVVMLRRPKAPGAAPTERKRDSRSMLGIGLQGLAYAIVWTPPRFGFARAVGAMNSEWTPLVIAWLLIIAMLMISGVAIARSAIYTLGAQWTLVAQAAKGHSLITAGPYARVRHPIYSAMLLLLIGTGLAMSGPRPFAIALVFFAAGTAQRVRLEENLLETSHGAEFRAYRHRVPAVVPHLR
jgi:protein-S-isoprenylcysteine O-methyltransferase Ste14